MFAAKKIKIKPILLLTFTVTMMQQVYCYQPLVNSKFINGWIFGADGGLNIVVAEDFKPSFPTSVYKGSGLTLRLISEYRLTPELNVRPLVGYALSQWYNNKKGNTFTSEYGTVDFKCDVLNLFSGYNAFRKNTLFVFAGGGVLYRNKISSGGFNDNARLLFLARTGGGIEFRLKKSVLMILNAELNFTGDKLNGYDAGKRSFDILPCLTMGLVYDFTPSLWGRWNY